MNDALFSVADQVVLVSGASRGIGRAIAEGFAKLGRKIVIIGGRAAAIVETAAALSSAGGTAVHLLVCVAGRKNVVRRVVQVVVDFCGIVYFVNVAGVNRRMLCERL